MQQQQRNQTPKQKQKLWKEKEREEHVVRFVLVPETLFLFFPSLIFLCWAKTCCVTKCKSAFDVFSPKRLTFCNICSYSPPFAPCAYLHAVWRSPSICFTMSFLRLLVFAQIDWFDWTLRVFFGPLNSEDYWV